MFCLRRIAILSALGFMCFASSVLGSGGPHQYIVFTNNTTVQVGVTTNANSTQIAAALSAESQSAFTSAGGVILNPGGTTSFSVQAGTYTVGASNWSNAATGVALTQITESVTVPANQTVNVAVNGGNPLTF